MSEADRRHALAMIAQVVRDDPFHQATFSAFLLAKQLIKADGIDSEEVILFPGNLDQRSVERLEQVLRENWIVFYISGRNSFVRMVAKSQADRARSVLASAMLKEGLSGTIVKSADRGRSLSMVDPNDAIQKYSEEK
jgi:hypothetical protein